MFSAPEITPSLSQPFPALANLRLVALILAGSWFLAQRLIPPNLTLQSLTTPNVRRFPSYYATF